MKNIPNVISLCRIFILIFMIFFIKNEFLLIILYLICGISDFADGYIARKTKSESVIGAKLDSIADLLMFSWILIYIVSRMSNEIRFIYFWIIFIGIIRVLNLFIVLLKYKTIGILHTWANKLTGVMVFFVPIIHYFFQTTFPVLFIIILAIFSSIEEMFIHIFCKKLELNRKSIFKQ